jgi:hypothetical protein
VGKNAIVLVITLTLHNENEMAIPTWKSSDQVICHFLYLNGKAKTQLITSYPFFINLSQG